MVVAVVFIAAAVASMVVDSAVEGSTAPAAFTAGTLADLEEVSAVFVVTDLAVSVMAASEVSVATDSSSAAAPRGSSDSISALVLTGTDIHTPTGGNRMPIRIPTIRITAQTIAITLRTRAIRRIIAITITTTVDVTIGHRAQGPTIPDQKTEPLHPSLRTAPALRVLPIRIM